MNSNFSTYQSPFTWRYGSPVMRHLFSEVHKYELWRSMWVALATEEYSAGLVTKKELDDLVAHEHEIDIERILEIEKETNHDVVAAVKEFAEKCHIGGGKIHFGATSMDISDNAEMIRMKEGIEQIEIRLKTILIKFSEQMDKTAEIVCMGYTHLQPAEPTTIGYRLAFYAQDLLTDFEYIRFVKKTLKGKGMKGAVGTRASYQELLEGTDKTAESLDQGVMKKIGIDGDLIATQVYSRKYDYIVATCLASIASSLAKFASDLRILQSPAFGEWAEPFGKTQVGSSAMPFKKNPIQSEKICSLARYVCQLPQVLLENATLSHLERTLDDSANRRIVLSELFLAVDEILITAEKLVKGIVFQKERITFNVNQFGPFSASESILIALVKQGADRQEMHEMLRTIAMKAWKDIQNGKENPMSTMLLHDGTIRRYISEEQLKKLLIVSNHVGDAPARVQKVIQKIKQL